MPVGQHLHLDVAWAVEVALDEDAVVPERGARLALRGLERAGELAAAAPRASLAATARNRLDDRREPVLGAEGADVLERRLALGTRDVGTPASRAHAFARALSPMRSIASAGGPTQVRPASATARANAGVSDRNP